MDVYTIVVGFLETNCYVATNGGGDAVIIDPGANPDRILEFISKRSLRVSRVLLTHGHNDHIGGIESIMRALNPQVLLQEKEADFIGLPPAGRRRFDPADAAPGFALLKDGDEIPLGDIRIKAFHTPGHTPGGACFLADSVCFTGDTLFNDGVGRTDFEGGSHKSIIQSIKSKLLSLDDDVKIYPGHGPSSTIGRERRYFQ
ncbi:MAG TPA: MBL fold metallo-hydrolase [bacterium]|nr:MBL fold metallo-hydrolase [bacterium]